MKQWRQNGDDGGILRVERLLPHSIQYIYNRLVVGRNKVRNDQQ